MKPATTIFACTHCDAQFSKWMGRCEECGSWGTVVQRAAAASAATPRQQRAEELHAFPAAQPIAFASITTLAVQRITTNIPEFDRVVGGGIVPGSLLLLGGDPGIGKSTLIAQVAAAILSGSVLYVSGEESAEQIKLRLDRLHIDQARLQFLAEEHVEVICKTMVATKPQLVIIDSIQTVASSAVEGEPGSVNQIKAAAVRFLETAKSSNIPVILIGHVTKGGELGGPRLLEHLVDTVLYLEGDTTHQFRLLRSVKNRFGATNEVGVFTMETEGLQSVQDPSALFLTERSTGPGSVITAVVEGSRVLLLEVQALVHRITFGFPQRQCSGCDAHRLSMLLAVLSRHLDVRTEQYDVHVNIAGGLRVAEPGLDLAVVLAIVSSLQKRACDKKMMVVGEVGLGGEVRSVPRLHDRVKEAQRFGLTTIITPKTTRTLADALTIAGLHPHSK